MATKHYFNARLLWNDEEAVFNNVKQFSVYQLFHEELVNDQVFPRVYLFLIQAVSKIFDHSRLSLRFLPFVCMLSAFFLWLKIGRRAITDSWAYLVFILSWCASVMLIYYAAELKQYSMDVLAAAIFIWFLYKQKDWESSKKKRSYLLILSALPLLGFFSYPAFFFMLFPLYNMIISKKNLRAIGLPGLCYGASLISVFFISYFFDMRLRHTGVVAEGWADYFISFSSPGAFFKTFGEGTINLFSRWFAEQPRIIKKISIFFFSLGLINMFHSFFVNFKKNGYYLNSIETLALVIYSESFFFGALKKYPFTVPRTSLFFCPVILYLTVQAIFKLRTINKPLFYVVLTLYVCFLTVISFLLSRLIIAGDMGAEPVLWR